MGSSSVIDSVRLEALRRSALDSTYVSLGGRRTASVHEFYRYPARFSPHFARAAIEAFTEPNELVIDPFAGGGTAVVEAQRSRRRSIGADINSLATFVTQAKVAVHPCDKPDSSAARVQPTVVSRRRSGTCSTRTRGRRFR